MLVTASNAATDGGMASAECASRDLRLLDEFLRCTSPWCRMIFCRCAVSWFDLTGIWTALEEVVGRAIAAVMVVLGGLRLGGDSLSDDSLRFPILRALLLLSVLVGLEEETRELKSSLLARSSFRLAKMDALVVFVVVVVVVVVEFGAGPGGECESCCRE